MDDDIPMTTTKTTKRTDVHRPSALIPAHYEAWNDYALPSMGGLCPRLGVDCADPIRIHDHQGLHARTEYPTCPDTGRCCVASTERHARRDGRAIYGHAGKCGVCGAHYLYGSMFRHEPTGEIVHLGHDCAQKYELMFDLSEFELALGRVRHANAKAIARAENAAERQAFFDAHPGIEAALALGKTDGSKSERILADMAGRFVTYRTLSDKQVAFAQKLADGIRNPKPEVVEQHCAAPIGKGIEFEGEIVSCKIADGYMGGATYKMTIKVTTTDGSTWLAFGTCPAALTACLGNAPASALRGRRISVKASLELPRPREPEMFETDAGRADAARKATEKHFVFMSRPTACFADVVDHPRYELPKCTIGEPCRVIRHAVPGSTGNWAPVTCDGRCKNVAKARKPRAKKAVAPTASP